MKRKVLLILIILLCLGCAGVAGYKIYEILTEYRSGEETYESIQQYIITPATVPALPSEPMETQINEENTEPAPTEPEKETVIFPIVDFDGLKQINEDVTAWVCIEGTRINYPVLQGENNREYLRKMIDGNANAAGSIFMDYRNHADFSDQNTILYGHNMNNGSMFADIRNYRNQSYYDEHPYILIMTPGGNDRYEIVAGYVAEKNEPAWYLKFATEEETMEWIDDAMSRSGFVSRTVPEPDDLFLTLSTCTYEFQNARFVLVAVKR